MNSDKPFQKSLAISAALSAILIIGFVVQGAPNIAYRLAYTLLNCLFAGVLTGAWGFVSKKQWSLARFIITVVGVCLLLGSIQTASKTRNSATVPKIAFAPELPASWELEKDWPVTAQGTITGHALVVQSKDKRRAIVVQASILPKSEILLGFKYTADEWKRGVLDSARDSYKGIIGQERFSITTVQGQEAAELSFQISTPQSTINLRNKAWMEKNAFASWQAICRGVPVLDDQEIGDILSRLKIIE